MADYDKQVRARHPERRGYNDDSIINNSPEPRVSTRRAIDDEELEPDQRAIVEEEYEDNEDEDTNEEEYDDNTEEEYEEEEEIEEEEPEPTYRKKQVQNIVETRVKTINNKVKKLEAYKSAVDRICEVTGLDFEKLSVRLEAMTDKQQADLLGMTEGQVKQNRLANQEATTGKKTNIILQRKLETQELKMNRRYRDLDLFQEEIDEILDDNPRLSVKQAYLLAKGDITTVAATRDAEALAVAKRRKATNRKVVRKPVSQGSNSLPKSRDPATKLAAQDAQMAEDEYAKFKNISNLDEYEADKAKNKKKIRR